MRFWTSPSLKEPAGRSFETTWEMLNDRFQNARPGESKEALARWAPVRFRADYRCLSNVVACYAVVLDVDSGCEGVRLRDATDGLRVYAHTTWNSRPESPRWRVVMPLDVAISAEPYGRVWRWAAALLERAGIEPDKQARDPSRAWAVPCRPLHGYYDAFATSGDLLPVAHALVEFPAPVERADDPYEPDRKEPYSKIVERCRAYVAKIPGAISGSGGHSATFQVAQVVARGFALENDDAMAIMHEYNQRCAPQWSTHELRHKLVQARVRGTMQWGRYARSRPAHWQVRPANVMRAPR